MAKAVWTVLLGFSVVPFKFRFSNSLHGVLLLSPGKKACCQFRHSNLAHRHSPELPITAFSRWGKETEHLEQSGRTWVVKESAPKLFRQAS